jgi:hypothetical protein
MALLIDREIHELRERVLTKRLSHEFHELTRILLKRSQMPNQTVPDIQFGKFVIAEIPKLFAEQKILINTDDQRGDIWNTGMINLRLPFSEEKIRAVKVGGVIDVAATGLRPGQRHAGCGAGLHR